MVRGAEASDHPGSGAKRAHGNVPQVQSLGQSLFHRWRRAYNGQGMQGLKPHYKTVDPEVKRLQQENDRLKKIIAKQALEIDFKDELLKKSL